MKILLLLLTSIVASAQWTKTADLDRELTRLTPSDTHLVAYSAEKVSSSTDGRNWSTPINPGFPILHISRTPSEDFVALSYREGTLASNPSRPYSILIMDSTDGINWTERREILYFEGFALPITGEIAVTETHFYLSVKTDFLGTIENTSFYGNDLQIEEDSFGHTNVVALDGDFFGEGPAFSNQPCRFTSVLPSSELNSPLPSWRSLSGYLDIRTASDGLLIGQNGISRKDDQIHYGNWQDLGEIKGYHNGIGLIITVPNTSAKLHLSRDFLRTWTEENLPEPQPDWHLDATFFKDQWFVLSASGSTNPIYSLPVEPVRYEVQGPAQLNVEYYDERVFTIPGCAENATTQQGVELTFPVRADQFFQVYTSSNLRDWTAYGLPFRGATTHHFPIVSGQGSLEKRFFRADEVKSIK